MIELDKHIISGKKPLTCFDAEQARNFVGKKCYLTNDISLFSDLNAFKDIKGCNEAIYEGVADTLTNINTEVSLVFETTYRRWNFCIPCEWVEDEKKEPKYRAYTMNEFKAEFKIGMVLTLRERDAPDYVYQVMYLGNRQYDESDGIGNTIFLSQRFFSLRELFNIFEIVRNGDWQPFGILEE